ncbi:ATP adenylyltransferase/5',5'''-P-1,P-4-tetraphosphate phosphorylase II [Dysgonomonas sp. PFB1-18]|uniref:DUF4922 domain-containing protein n=1 Tax=unclassified Dysgonomonas TaxID=2630389 RepID=UPI002474715A|nr:MULTISPECIES: DUF4922 domain-containing protein [unclassified Dysgonomonas]MDH6308723.1 ATP adenylyltransferase/5',5'''-P-1,P-4-tetraphosphate phosphorylase II [Dysgonomonas sp. PF1-14]MDH6338580.1 ATP adenylyltransferase/5',5'''-P-1,P-4-tetraphosphate phosphorylase II [Dysgonomonas sp. PF1-16]MDH6379972.1 ATP adenylyltransferase/5',5'''-P-1,P-4-tetraphosphate phosphorylase II [Dysgonomonas sp. PFB1-18]MDH6397408.1 ATP adenylyltransferase/5',5'''-P-1,P-4-tetraphosphate phosphorylase II [Dysg
MNLTSIEARNLLRSQLAEWALAKSNFEALNGVETKEFQFNGFMVRVQFNPARIQSSAAKVDKKSIQERKCFLCPANLPAEQRGIPFGDQYQVLVNPFPIFPEHFTMPTYNHTDQLILNRYGNMLDLAQALDEYTIFYNGPKCGASAPDHAHFQAGIKGFLPLEKDLKNAQFKETIYQSAEITVYAIRNYLRNGFLLEAKDKTASVEYFSRIYSLLELKSDDKEPMMNTLTWYDNNRWHTCIFPRKRHRPTCFYAEGDDNLLISPASVDLGGVFITPLEKDFKKIAEKDIKDILKEICIGDDKMQTIIDKLKDQ